MSRNIPGGLVGLDSEGKIPDDFLYGPLLTAQLISQINANTAKVSNVTTDLSYVPSPSDGTVVSSDGTNAIIPMVTNSTAGLMLPSDKIKLDNLITRSDLNFIPSSSYGTITNSNGKGVTLPEADALNAGLMSNTDKINLENSVRVINEILGQDSLTLSSSFTIPARSTGDFVVNIPKGIGYLPLENSNYTVILSPSSPIQGHLGEFAVTNRTKDKFNVRFTGIPTTIDIRMDYIICKDDITDSDRNLLTANFVLSSDDPPTEFVVNIPDDKNFTLVDDNYSVFITPAIFNSFGNLGDYMVINKTSTSFTVKYTGATYC